MTAHPLEIGTVVHRSVRILATAGFAVLAAAGIATLLEVRGFFGRPHSVLLDLSAAETDQCVVERDEMTSSGNDAKLVWDVFSGDGIRLDIQVDAGEATFLDAFWETQDQPAFSPARCLRTPLSAGNNRLALPIRGKIRRLRLDFGNAPDQTFLVSSIRVRSGLRLARPWSWRVFGLRSAILFFPVFLLLLHVALPADCIWSFIDRNRFVLAGSILAFAVAFELHGSSIGMWNRFVPNGHAEPPLFGIERAIRSDEYAVFTPMTLAQSFANPAWPYFNDIPRAARTDMFSVYAQPVRHPLLVFRPFLAGHVLFGFRRGLSFFWVGRWLAILLVLYELFKLLTNGDKPLSAVASAMVALSPVVQWWGAINALAEMLVFGSLSVLCLDRFMTGRTLRNRWISVVGIGYCGVAYAMTLYPAAQVPFAYAFGALALWTILRRAKGFHADVSTWAFAGIVVLAAAGCLAWYLRLSSESFRILADTAYPGRRFSCGGGFWKGFGLSWGNVFFPWTDHHFENSNSFECSAFFDFFPLGLVLAVCLFIRRKRLDALSLFLIAVSVFLGAFSVVGLPRWMAATTLMSRSTNGRTFVAFEFLQLLLFVRTVSLLRPSLRFKAAVPTAVVFAGLSTLLAHYAYPTYLSRLSLALVFVLSASGFFLWFRFSIHRLLAPAFFVVLAFFGGAFVNPIQRGDAGVSDSDLFRAISDIAKTDPGAWLVEGTSFPMNQYPLLAGARTVNAGNLYPEVERWRTIDPTEQDRITWNRYAECIRVDLRPGGDCSFHLTAVLSFRVEASPRVLADWNVRHVLTRNDLERFNGSGLQFILEKRVAGWNIYSLVAERVP